MGDDVIRVPLVMLGFGSPPPKLAAAAFPSQVDIAPTLLHELGMPIPPTWQGHALHQPPVDDFLYYQQGPLTGLLDRRAAWKYWQHRDGAEHAFDLTADPHETRNRIGSAPPQQLAQWRLALLPVLGQSAGGRVTATLRRALNISRRRDPGRAARPA